MNIIRLYYVTGTLFIILTMILSTLSILSIESALTFILGGILFLVLGLVQHVMLLHELTH